MPFLKFLRESTVSGVYLAALTLLAGCGGMDDLAEVTGQVTLDGKPLNDAMIIFSPTSAGTTSYGRTDVEGKFRMIFNDNQSGAWKGENLVRITTGDVAGGPNGGGKPEVVPVTYNRKSTLKVDVKPGENVHNFELQSSSGRVIQPPKE